MKYNFDEYISREQSDALKYVNRSLVFGNPSVLPLWVADMEFATPSPILDAVKQRLDGRILGYTKPSKGYFTAIQSWLHRRYDWHIDTAQIGFVGGIVPGLSFALQTFTEKNDEVLIQTPVYAPFIHLPCNAQRVLKTNSLVLSDKGYTIDMDDFIAQITPATKVFILCNPHNPVGRVWNKEELQQLAEVCYDRNVLVISDEIHSDLTLPGYQHIPFATVSEKAKMNSITFMAPSKTFNMAGLSSSFYIAENPEIFNRFNRHLVCGDFANGHIFSFVAAEAAYNQCEEWLKEMALYLKGNINFVADYLRTNLPQITFIHPEASFLLWLNCKEMGLSHTELKEFFINEAGVGMNDGMSFGTEGEYFFRMNIGSPRELLHKALEQIKNAALKRGLNNQ